MKESELEQRKESAQESSRVSGVHSGRAAGQMENCTASPRRRHCVQSTVAVSNDSTYSRYLREKKIRYCKANLKRRGTLLRAVEDVLDNVAAKSMSGKQETI